VTLDAVPVDWLPPGIRLPAEWILQRQSGARTRLRVRQPIRPAQWDLMDTIALHSDYRVGTANAGHLGGYEELGVAIAGAGELSAFANASPAESRRILGHLKQRLLEVEEAEMARWLEERRESPGGDPQPITLSRTYRGPVPGVDEPFGLERAVRRFKGRTYYYLTGEKLYLMGLKDFPDCKVNLSFAGIVIAHADGKIVSEKVSAGAYAEYCGDAAESMTPLAAVLLNGRMIWIVKYSVEDGYDYGLFDPDANEEIALKGSWGLRH
jgi:hypothetical protein